MSKQEKQFQSYFMKIAKPLNYHRTSLSSGGGFPDIVGFHGEKHSLVELKDLVLGKRGDRKLSGCFEDSQPPWYINYFKNGGSRLFVAFRIRDYDETNKRYGLWQLTKQTVLDLDTLKYSDLKEKWKYTEYEMCKEMIEAIEHEPGAR